MSPILVLMLISLPADSMSPTAQLLKVLSYDRNLAARTPEGLLLAIVFDAKTDTSREDASSFQVELRALSSQRSPLVPAATEMVAFTNENDLSRALVARSISAVYVARGLGASLPAVIHAAEEAGVMTLAGDPEDVARGLAASVARHGDTGRIVVNMGAAERCGVDFDPAVRQVAQRVGANSSEPERSDLSAALTRYREAIQNKDMAGLRALWPGLTDSEAKQVEASMKNLRTHLVFLAPLRIDTEGERRKIRVRRTDQLITKTGEKMVSGRIVEIILFRSDSGLWVIDSMKGV